MSSFKLLVGILVLCISTIAVPSPSSQKLDTKDWATYRNDAMKFEVKHPNSWHVKLATGSGAESVSIDRPYQANKPNMSVQFFVQRQINPKGLTIKGWITEQMQKLKTNQLPTTDTLLGGRPAIRWERTNSLGKSFTFFASLNKTDIFQIVVYQSATQAQIDQTYETIISTVKFNN